MKKLFCIFLISSLLLSVNSYAFVDEYSKGASTFGTIKKSTAPIAGAATSATYYNYDADGTTILSYGGISRSAGIEPVEGLAFVDSQTVNLQDKTAFPQTYGTNFYVDGENGLDTNDGKSLKTAFKTVNRAMQAVNSLAAPVKLKSVTVFIRGGVYNLSSPINIINTTNGIINFVAYNGESVTITNTEKISYTDFTSINDQKIIDKLKTNVSNTDEVISKMVQVNLRSLGMTDYRDLQYLYYNNREIPSDVFFTVDSQMETLSRWPNKYGNYQKISQMDSNDPAFAFQYGSTAPYERWSDFTGGWAAGYFAYDWDFFSAPINNVSTGPTGTITLSIPYYYALSQTSEAITGRYYVYNLIQELDSPGEWYLDRTTGILYYYPKDDFGIDSDIRFVTSTNNLVSLNNTNNVKFTGLTFEGTCANAISIKNSNNVVVDNCIIKNVGQQGVNIDGGSNNVIMNCEIYSVGKGGVIVRGGNRDTLTSCNHEVYNNDIHDYSMLLRTNMSAVDVNAVGARVARNKMYNSAHSAIMYKGNNNIFEYNEIFNVCNETLDCGAIYSGRSYTMMGNIIRYNYIHDLKRITNGSNNQIVGIYLDDFLSGQVVYGNYIKNVPVGLFNHGGHYNVFTNNIVENADFRPLWAQKAWDPYGDDSMFKAPNGEMYKDIMSVPYNSPVWQQQFPKLKLLADEILNYQNNIDDLPSRSPTGVKMYNNFLNGKGTDFAIMNDNGLQFVCFEAREDEQINLSKFSVYTPAENWDCHTSKISTDNTEVIYINKEFAKADETLSGLSVTGTPYISDGELIIDSGQRVVCDLDVLGWIKTGKAVIEYSFEVPNGKQFPTLIGRTGDYQTYQFCGFLWTTSDHGIKVSQNYNNRWDYLYDTTTNSYLDLKNDVTYNIRMVLDFDKHTSATYVDYTGEGVYHVLNNRVEANNFITADYLGVDGINRGNIVSPNPQSMANLIPGEFNIINNYIDGFDQLNIDAMGKDLPQKDFNVVLTNDMGDVNPVFADDNYIQVNLDLNGHSELYQNGVAIIMATYNDDNRLMRILMTQANSIPYDSRFLFTGMRITNKETISKLKIFVMKNTDNMIPLTESIVLE